MIRPDEARSALALAILGMASCASPAIELDRPAVDPNATLLRVEVYRGLVGGEIGPRDEHVVVDVTTALGEVEPPEDGADLSAFARDIAGPNLGAPADQPTPMLHSFHRGRRLEEDYTCAGSGREPFAARAIASLETELGAQAAGTHVRLYTELHDECLPDFCKAAESLVAAGAWLDVVLIGDDEPPACLNLLSPSTGPVSALEKLQPDPPAFRVERLAPDTGSAGVQARGKAGQPAIKVAPGLYNIVVEVEPEEQIGPVRFEAGQSLLAKLMDFPLSAPNRRRWKVEVLDAGR